MQLHSFSKALKVKLVSKMIHVVGRQAQTRDDIECARPKSYSSSSVAR